MGISKYDIVYKSDLVLQDIFLERYVAYNGLFVVTALDEL